MKRILFVDDEPMVLAGLRRMLRAMRGEWEMEFALGGPEALEIVKQRSFNVIVTDMRMPGMDGCELLRRVKEIRPRIVRIILSGHSDKELILKSVGPAHQFLSKPCDPETLKIALSRSCALNDMLEDESLIDLVSGIESLPSVPALYTEVMRAINSPDGSLNRVGEIISNDVAMSAKILQVVNSAFFGLPKHIANPVRAVNLLGLETVRALIISVKIFSEYSTSNFPDCSLNTLWDHSLRTALFARSIAREQGLCPNLVDEAFMSGLLHDAGKLILMEGLPGKFRSILDRMNTEDCFQWEAEQEILGTTHAEVGAYLMGIWGLAETIVEAIAFHHRPAKFGGNTFNMLSAVHAANAIEHGQSAGSDVKTDSRLDLEYIERIGCMDRLDDWKTVCAGLKDQGETNERKSPLC